MDEIKNKYYSNLLVGNNRGARIFEEFVVAKETLQHKDINNTIVLFGSARLKPDDKNPQNRFYYQAAQSLAYKLATWSKEVFMDKPKANKFYICTGGGGGIMEAANRGASEAGEKTLGFNITLPFEQSANQYIPEDLVFQFHYFFIRKFYFAFLAKAFAIFPGGFGTFDELFEILTLAQTQKMQKLPPFVIFGKDFFKNVLNIDMLLSHGFISESDKNLFLLTDDVDEAFDHIIKNIKLDSGFVNLNESTEK